MLTLLAIGYTQVHGFFSEPKHASGNFYDPYDRWCVWHHSNIHTDTHPTLTLLAIAYTPHNIHTLTTRVLTSGTVFFNISINRCVLNIQVVFLNITYFFGTRPGTLQGILKDLPILPHIFTRTQKCKKFIHTSVGLKFIHTSVDGRRSTFKGSLIHGCDAYTAGISGYSARIEAAVYHSLS